uniref:Uncharacterized protein n=1 Tax=Oncorhynchus tshawytscha TaxID=74940 RepID=A0AAZ3QKE2_ONCTS
MAVSMRRMNGSWRGLTLALVLCALFLHNGVQAVDPTDSTAAPDTVITDAPSSVADNTSVLEDAPSNPTVRNGAQTVDPTDPSAAPDTVITDAPSSVADNTSVLEDAPSNPTVRNDTATTVADATVYDTTGASAPGSDQDTAFSSMVPTSDFLAGGETSATTAGPGVDTQGTEATDALVVPKTQVLVNPNVECVDKEAVKDKDAVKVELSSETSCVSSNMFYCHYEMSPYGCFPCRISICALPPHLALVYHKTEQYSLNRIQGYLWYSCPPPASTTVCIVLHSVSNHSPCRDISLYQPTAWETNRDRQEAPYPSALVPRFICPGPYLAPSALAWEEVSVSFHFICLR